MKKLDDLSPAYMANECNLDMELFLPVASVSSEFDCMGAYFTSGVLRELSHSISCYFANESSLEMRFIVGPQMSCQDDIDALRATIKARNDLIPILFPNFEISEKNLRSNTVKALCYLVGSGKLTLKIAVMENDSAIFHTKCWFFKTDEGNIVIHGSGNPTASGLSRNMEQVNLCRAWQHQTHDETYDFYRKRFDALWNGTYESVITVPLNTATLNHIERIKKELNSDPDALIELKRSLRNLLTGVNEHKAEYNIVKLTVPDWLNYSSGVYSHQGKAINAWFENDRKGILSIATGGGKTITSLVVASLLNHETDLFVVIAVPTKVLLNQWVLDVEHFGVTPISADGKNKQSIKRAIKDALRRLRHGTSKSEVLLVTHVALKSDILSDLGSGGVPLLLIADEVHNLGSAGFKSSPPDFFPYKIGLSATHERQFDSEGTAFLLDYFGGVVFEYSLKEAIGKCLVPYEYYVHEVPLTAEEEDDFCDLTFQIRKLSYAAEYDDSNGSKQKWQRLCLKRRRLIETAKNKIRTLDNILPKSKDEIGKTLIFCTDKHPRQIEEINALLEQRSLNYHQITQGETSKPNQLKELIEDFTKGKMQVLTSKRVLNEGFNVPQVETAYLVASNTVKRDWVQRLGRVLRQSSETGKSKAVIHDFLVLPSVNKDGMDKDAKTLLMSEYDRLSFFTELSSNGLEYGGSLYKANMILELMRSA